MFITLQGNVALHKHNTDCSYATLVYRPSIISTVRTFYKDHLNRCNKI